MRLRIVILLGLAACGGGVSLGQTGQGQTGADGGSSSGGDGSSSGGSGTGIKECTSKADCGPQPAMPAIACADGSAGGYTGRCLQQVDGSCKWENRTCPPSMCFM